MLRGFSYLAPVCAGQEKLAAEGRVLAWLVAGRWRKEVVPPAEETSTVGFPQVQRTSEGALHLNCTRRRKGQHYE